MKTVCKLQGVKKKNGLVFQNRFEAMMDSPLSRTILAVLGGYVLILLGLFVHDWITTEYPRPPAETPNTARIQHTFAHHAEIDAMRRFNQSPRAEQEAILKNLKNRRSPSPVRGRPHRRLLPPGR